MKKYSTLLVILAVLLASTTEARNLRAFLSYAIFRLPGDGPYIETYLSVDGQSVNFSMNENGMFQSAIEVTLIFKKNDTIVDFDKYMLLSPEIEDTNNVNFNFLDQQRYFIPEGEYQLEIAISDKKAMKKPYTAVQPVNIFFNDDKVTFSGIELIDHYSQAEEQSILTKSGLDMIPMISNFYPEDKTTLTYYTEIYNTDKILPPGEKFLVASFIKSFETGSIIKGYTTYKRTDAGAVAPVLNSYDISDLPSGNYKLLIEARDRENNLLSMNEIFFQRSNPSITIDINELTGIDVSRTFAHQITSEDTLDEFIRCLAPRATQVEKNFIYNQVESTDLRTKQQFFYNFWKIRDEKDPYQAWLNYYELVRIVNAAYKTQIQKGYETDRGRVYLQYGPPNIITESYYEPSSYPYEIWQYYELGPNQRNKKFVFYTYDLITNNFKLLHSDAIGEISNYRWQVFLNNRWFDPYDLDADKPPDIYGGKADDYYRNPR